MGARLLRSYVKQPLIDKDEIIKRQDFIEELNSKEQKVKYFVTLKEQLTMFNFGETIDYEKILKECIIQCKIHS